MQFLWTFLMIILFIFCLSVLITIHELGHFLMAKAFGVYCFEFSIGFGPKIFSKKRKDGETAFSMRWIPFGGYVSMYGEGMELPEGVEIPKERSLNGVKKWKRVIILAAGVTMNALLALAVFFSYEAFCPKDAVYANQIKFVEKEGFESPLKVAGYNPEGELIYFYTTNKDEAAMGIDPNATVLMENGETKEVFACIERNLLGFDYLDWDYYLHFCKKDADGNISLSKDDEIFASDTTKSVTFTISSYSEYTEEGEPKVDKSYTITLEKILDENDKYRWAPLGVEMTHIQYRLDNFGEIVKNTFVDFGEGSIAIVKGFAQMFTTKEGFESAGGLIAIGYETSNVLKNYGFPQFLSMWGLISVNLAIVNLFPFPGLDGWQILVLIVEAIAHKEIPQKVKSIMSLIGIGLLFCFMIFLLFKDFFVYVI